MAKFSCPACGAEIQFKSRVSVFGVCSFCSSMVVRHDLNLETMGKMAELPPDMSPLQVGVRGRYEGKAFELIGRLKISWSDGNWNEWYALFDDGSAGWLAEAQGFYMVSFQVPLPDDLPGVQNIFAGRTLTLSKGQDFEVDDIKEVICEGSEGELPVKAQKGRKSTNIDLVGADRQFASLDCSPEGNRLFIGKYVDFEKLSFTSLREIDGW